MKTLIENTKEAIIDYLENLENGDIINIHNTYCQENNYNDDEEFFNLHFENKPMEAVRAANFGDYNYSHDWVKFNGYGNLDSFNSPSDNIDINAIADDILENPERYDIELEDIEEEN